MSIIDYTPNKNMEKVKFTNMKINSSLFIIIFLIFYLFIVIFIFISIIPLFYFISFYRKS